MTLINYIEDLKQLFIQVKDMNWLSRTDYSLCELVIGWNYYSVLVIIWCLLIKNWTLVNQHIHSTSRSLFLFYPSNRIGLFVKIVISHGWRIRDLWMTLRWKKKFIDKGSLVRLVHNTERSQNLQRDNDSHSHSKYEIIGYTYIRWDCWVSFQHRL